MYSESNEIGSPFALPIPDCIYVLPYNHYLEHCIKS